MPRAKISEFSTTAGDNTDIDGINIAEGCAPSGINDAIRELMAQLKDFQSGAAGDNITVVGTLAAKGTSSSGADLKLYEDTDNGTNYVGFIAPASIASNVQWTLPSADGSSGQALQTNGSGTLSFATLGISAGGTGQTTANAAFNALAPSQTSNAGRYLKTDGTNTSWDLLDISTADITGTLPVANGGTGITSFGTGVATALGINVGSSGAFVTNGGALGTPSSGTVTNLTGTASININGTVGATTPNTGSFTTLTTSSTVTINGGTANGVAYLNASKVLTTGSALTFDGTRLTSVTGKFGGGAASNSASLMVNNITNTATGIQLFQDGIESWIMGMPANSAGLAWSASGAERMRLTSTGLGVGTSSPAYKLDVVGVLRVTNSAGNESLILTGSSNTASIQQNGSDLYFNSNTNTTGGAFIWRNTSGFTERMRITSAGDVGIGTTSPLFRLDARGASGTGISYIETTTGNTNRIQLGATTGAGYINATAGSGSSVLQLQVANSTRATLDSSGNLGLGVTPSAWTTLKAVQLPAGSIAGFDSGTSGRQMNVLNNAFFDGTNFNYVATGPALAYRMLSGEHRWFTAASGTAGNTISFTQAMTLSAANNLLVGVTTDTASARAVVGGTVISTTNTVSTFSGDYAGFDRTSSKNMRIFSGSSDATGSSIEFYAGVSGSVAERARITSVGNMSLGGTANRGTTVGTNALQIFNGTAPAGTLTNGVSLYSSSGDLFFMDAAGTASRVGFRGVPQSGSAKTGSYTLATTDVGDYIEVGSGGSITIPDATFATGDVVSIFNNTSGNITITCTITTAYIAGTDADKASVTLATRGVATILFISGTVCVISGNVS